MLDELSPYQVENLKALVLKLRAQAGREDDEEVNELLALACAAKDQDLFECLIDELQHEAILEELCPTVFSNSASELLVGESLEIAPLSSNPNFIVGLLKKSLNLHTGVFGPTGAGKTIELLNLVPKAIALGVLPIIFDPHDEFKALIKTAPMHQYLIFEAKDFPLNIFEIIPGESVSDRIASLSTRLRENFYILEGGQNLFMDITNQLYEKYPNPNIVQFFHLLKKKKVPRSGRISGYLESLVNRFMGLMLSMPGLLCMKGIPLHELFDKHPIIFRLNGLNDEHCKFFVHFILTYLERYRQSNPVSGLKNLVVLEEANLFFSKEDYKKANINTPPLEQIMRGIRKRGVGIICSFQTASDLPSAVISNLANCLIFGLSNFDCIMRLGKSRGLTKEQMEYIATMQVQERECVLSSRFFPEPYLLKIPELKEPEKVTEEEIRSYMKPLMAGFHIVPIRLNPWELTTENVFDLKKDSTGELHLFDRKLAERESQRKVLLRSAALHPEFTTTQHYRSTGLTNGDKVKKQLVELELIQPNTVSFGRYKGDSASYFEITSKGCLAIDFDPKDAALPGQGAFKTKLILYFIKKGLEKKGYKAIQEGCSNGKKADLVYFDENYDEVAIEFESKVILHSVKNVVDDLSSGFDRVIFIVMNEEERSNLTKMLDEIDGIERDKVSVELLKEWV